MTEFDYQWQYLDSSDLELNGARVQEFLKFTKLKTSDIYHKIAYKYVLDAGCGSGRYTYAMLTFNPMRIDSIDISPSAIEKCKLINGEARIADIATERFYPIYDFVLCYGVIHHYANPRRMFHNLCDAVKNGGMLHIMVYHKDTQKQYFQDRVTWRLISEPERLELCKQRVKEKGGTIHGWYDALNPQFNYGFKPKEIVKWFKEEGFKNIRVTQKKNIHINGIMKRIGECELCKVEIEHGNHICDRCIKEI